MSDTPQPTPPQAERLGEILQGARVRQGLELSDIAQSTHVRRDYLQALEEGRYDELPEDVYSRNFLRLYAQAVDLDEAEMVQLFEREKPARHQDAFENAAIAGERRDRVLPPRTGAGRFGGWIATLLLVVVLVALAVWGFNSFMFRPSRVAVPAAQQDPVAAGRAEDSEAEPATDEPSPTPAAANADGTVLLSVTSIPEGAEVSVDNYTLPGTTPVTDMPVTAGEGRILRVSLPGFQTYEHAFDMSFDRNLSVALSPVQPAAPTGEAGQTAETAPGPGAQEGQLALSIEEASWLEVYEGTGRGQGRTLLYRTVQPGESFAFDLPVYLHVGNAGGVHISVGGQDRGLLGSSGEVVSRAFPRP